MILAQPHNFHISQPRQYVTTPDQYGNQTSDNGSDPYRRPQPETDGNNGNNNSGLGHGGYGGSGNGGGGHGGSGHGGNPKQSPDAALLSSLQRGQKRDMNAFPELKSEVDWHEFQLKTVAIGRAQGVGKVFDPHYIPRSMLEGDAFQIMCEFMHAVFINKINTPVGKTIVRRYGDGGNAHACWQELCTYHQTSSRATLSRSDMMRSLTGDRLDLRRYRGSITDWLVDWDYRCTLYNDAQHNDSSRIGTAMKTSLLANAVSTIPDLVSVKTAMDTHFSNFGMTDNNFLQYFTLLLRAAATLDYKRGVESISTTSHHRTIHMLEQAPYNDDDPEYPSLEYDINATQRNPAATLPLPTWKAISPDGRAIWDQLTDADKTAIISGKPRNPGSGSQRRPTSRQAHLTNVSTDVVEIADDTDQPAADESPLHDNLVINALTGNSTTPVDSQHPPGSINRLLGKPSNNKRRTANHLQFHALRYDIHAKSSAMNNCLVDRGANGCIIGFQMHVIETYPDCHVDITGIDNHELPAVPLGAGGMVVRSNHGNIIAIIRHGVILPTHKTILSSVQMESFKIVVNDVSPSVGGHGLITTPEGYIIPLMFRQGLPYVPGARPYTDTDWKSLPHVFLTQETHWDPSNLDYTVPDEWFTTRHDPPINAGMPYDNIGNHRLLSLSVHYAHFPSKPSHTTMIRINRLILAVETRRHIDARDATDAATHPPALISAPIDGEIATPLLTYDADSDIDEEGEPVSMETDTMATHDEDGELQDGEMGSTDATLNDLRVHDYDQEPDDPLQHLDTVTVPNKERKLRPSKRNWLSLMPYLLGVSLITLLRTLAATTQYGRRCKYAQLFIGTQSLVADATGVTTDKEFASTLLDNIKLRGAMDVLITDSAKSETSHLVQEILRMYIIEAKQSEPHYQHQNPFERRFGVIKRLVNNKLMNLVGAPAETWLLALEHVCMVMNCTATESLGWRTPLEKLAGVTPDISALLCFHFYEPVYYKRMDAGFPSESTERLGYWVGVSANVGHAMTYKVLTADTKKIIHRSVLRSAAKEGETNRRLDPLTGKHKERPDEVVKDPDTLAVEKDDDEG